MNGGFRGRGRGRYGGHKRRRDEHEPMDPSRSLLKSLMNFGDDLMPVSSASDTHPLLMAAPCVIHSFDKESCDTQCSPEEHRNYF